MGQRTTPPKRGFEKATMQEANEGCGQFVGRNDRCAVCQRPVVLHCAGCKVQVTGCLCTLKEKIANDMMLSAAEQEMAKKAGLWVPPGSV